MCAKPEDIIDYRDLTPDEWQRERQQILTRAQAARAGAMRELHALDDRSLRDIGVSRSEIEWVVSSQQAARVRAAVKAVRPRRHWPAADRGTPAKPQQVGKGLTDKCAA